MHSSPNSIISDVYAVQSQAQGPGIVQNTILIDHWQKLIFAHSEISTPNQKKEKCIV